MGFETGPRRGRYWDDCQALDALVKKHDFNTTGKSERDFEIGFSSSMNIISENFNSNIITQTNKSASVRSVYCFGKNHRPDMTLDEDGIAIELKFVTYAGLKDAIGQGYLYRLRYRFVFLILIISEQRSEIYYDLDENKEKDLHDTLRHLADQMNIFTYVVPAFSTKSGAKKCISYFT